MAELIKDEDNSQGGALRAHPSEGAPFDGEGKTLTVTKDVNLDQLLEEIYDRLGDRLNFNVVATLRDLDALVSEENPAVIHVHPATADMRTVRGAVESHVKDPYFGMDDRQRELAELKSRLTTEDLTNEELNTLLRGMLG